MENLSPPALAGESFPLREFENGILKVFMAFGIDRGCWGQDSRDLYVIFMKKSLSFFDGRY